MSRPAELVPELIDELGADVFRFVEEDGNLEAHAAGGFRHQDPAFSACPRALEEAFVFQLAERLRNRGVVDAKLLRKGMHPRHMPMQFPGSDAITQKIRNLLGA